MASGISDAEREERRVLRFRIAAGVVDFFGIACCTFLILALFALLVNLYAWLRTDISQTFAGLTQNVTDAVFFGQ